MKKYLGSTRKYSKVLVRTQKYFEVLGKSREERMKKSSVYNLPPRQGFSLTQFISSSKSPKVNPLLPKNDRPGDDGTLRSVYLLVFLLGVIDIASTSA